MAVTKNLTKIQRRVMELIRDHPTNNPQLRVSHRSGDYGPDTVTYRTIESLADRDLISYSMSGGWVSVTTRDRADSMEYAGEHVVKKDLALIVDVLRKVGGRVNSHWELYEQLRRHLDSQMTLDPMMVAVRYGGRKGVLRHGEGYDYYNKGWWVELVTPKGSDV